MTKIQTMTVPILLPAALLLAACSPAPSDAPGTTAASAAPGAAPTAKVLTRNAATAQATQGEESKAPPSATTTTASISGAIRDGNRAPPALRVCATPIDGGAPTCIDTPPGAPEYRIEVAPGRYYVLGWAGAGELTLIAHASQIRCIRPPCPPDALIEVGVTAGQQRNGVDLNGGYVEIPEGWPQRPG